MLKLSFLSYLGVEKGDVVVIALVREMTVYCKAVGVSNYRCRSFFCPEGLAADN